MHPLPGDGCSVGQSAAFYVLKAAVFNGVFLCGAAVVDLLNAVLADERLFRKSAVFNFLKAAVDDPRVLCGAAVIDRLNAVAAENGVQNFAAAFHVLSSAGNGTAGFRTVNILGAAADDGVGGRRVVVDFHGAAGQPGAVGMPVAGNDQRGVIGDGSAAYRTEDVQQGGTGSNGVFGSSAFVYLLRAVFYYGAGSDAAAADFLNAAVDG